MAYNRNELSQSKSGDYDKIFHQNTGSSNNKNTARKLQGNDKILNYRLFSGQYELSQQPFENSINTQESFNENARKNRSIFQNSMSVNEFNSAVDNLHLPQDMQRPLATRDQVKGYYDDENKANRSLKSMNKANEYFSKHQFMPSTVGNRTSGVFDMYSMTLENEKRNAYQDMI